MLLPPVFLRRAGKLCRKEFINHTAIGTIIYWESIIFCLLQNSRTSSAYNGRCDCSILKSGVDLQIAQLAVAHAEARGTTAGMFRVGASVHCHETISMAKPIQRTAEDRMSTVDVNRSKGL